MEAVTREAYLRRIRFLRDRGLHWVVDEVGGYVTALECLEDDELVRIEEALDRARRCVDEGVPFEDADLVPMRWGDGQNCANHVSVRPAAAENVANHVSAPAEPEFVHVPWHQRPENTF